MMNGLDRKQRTEALVLTYLNMPVTRNWHAECNVSTYRRCLSEQLQTLVSFILLAAGVDLPPTGLPLFKGAAVYMQYKSTRAESNPHKRILNNLFFKNTATSKRTQKTSRLVHLRCVDCIFPVTLCHMGATATIEFSIFCEQEPHTTWTTLSSKIALLK